MMNIRKTMMTLALSASMAGALMGISGKKTVYAAEKPAYLKSVTYFGDEWPINYWGSEDENMSANFAKIKADGFNSIILVIPWREFQPENGKEEWNQAAFDKLHKVMTCAEEHGLWVTLRIGYTWDYYGPSELPVRFAGVTKKDSEDRAMWLRYSQAVYQAASAHGNFHSGFITWEDFWNYVHNMGRNLSQEERVRLAQECGFTEYLRSNYSLEEVNSLYGMTFTRYEEIGIPERKSPAAALFFEYYDQFLNEFLAETQTVFPGISMEVRADGDPIYDPEGTYYYSHKATYPCSGAEYSAVMYSVSMGQKNEYDRISAETALEASDRTLSSLAALSGKKLYAEQLLYMDSTEEFSHNTQVLEDEVDDYVRALAPALQKSTIGYGLWVYRNYVNNCVYNGQFGLGENGWIFTNGSRVEEVDGTSMAMLAKGSSIAQNLTGRMAGSANVYVEFKAKPEFTNSVVTVQLGNKVQEVKVPKAGTYKCQFTNLWDEEFAITLSCSKRAYVDDIRVYTYEQYGRIYDKEGKEQDLADDFRILNSRLP